MYFYVREWVQLRKSVVAILFTKCQFFSVWLVCLSIHLTLLDAARLFIALLAVQPLQSGQASNSKINDYNPSYWFLHPFRKVHIHSHIRNDMSMQDENCTMLNFITYKALLFIKWTKAKTNIKDKKFSEPFWALIDLLYMQLFSLMPNPESSDCLLRHTQFLSSAISPLNLVLWT